MSIYERIHEHMLNNYKGGNQKMSSMLKYMLAEIQRNPNKDYSDETVIGVMSKVVKDFGDNKYVNYSDEVKYIEDNFLPKKATTDEILAFLQTIDFSTLKNRLMAVGMVTSHFPKGTVDGSAVKNLIMMHYK